MEIDVRTVDEVAPNKIEIRYGDDTYDFVKKGVIGDFIVIAEMYEGSVELKDIDNLIKALQKAKELWS